MNSTPITFDISPTLSCPGGERARKGAIDSSRLLQLSPPDVIRHSSSRIGLSVTKTPWRAMLPYERWRLTGSFGVHRHDNPKSGRSVRRSRAGFRGSARRQGAQANSDRRVGQRDSCLGTRNACPGDQAHGPPGFTSSQQEAGATCRRTATASITHHAVFASTGRGA